MYYYSRQGGFIFRLTYLLLTLFFHAAIFLVALIGLAHFWLPLVADYKPLLEKELSDFVGNQVSIGGIRIDHDSGELRWMMENLQLTEPSGYSPIYIQKLTLRVDWRESLRTLRLQPSDVRVEGVELILRHHQGELPEVAGLQFPLPGQKNTVLNIERESPIQVHVDGGYVHWMDMNNRHTLTLHDVQFTGEFLPNAITVQADALFPPAIGESIAVDLELQRKPLEGELVWAGNIHAQTHIFNLAALPLPHVRESGLNAGALQLDVDIQAQAGKPLHVAGSGEIKHLGFKGTDKVPALQGVNAQFKADSAGGTMQVKVEDSELDYPVWFDKAIAIEALQARLDWSVDDNGWLWQLRELALRNPDVAASGTAELSLPSSTEPTIALDLDFKTRQRVNNVADYIPAVIKDSTERWLKRAIVQGHVPQGKMQVRGKLLDFPFKHGKGGFYDISFDVEDGILDYLPQWPAAHDVKGHLRFRNAGMDGTVHSATVMGLAVKGGSVRIPNMLKNARLLLELDTEGDLAQHMDFLQAAPIGKKLREPMKLMEFAGKSRLNLQLETALKKSLIKKEGVKVLGRLQLDNTRFAMPEVQQSFSNMQGEVQFDRFGVSAQQVKARYKSAPVTLQAQTKRKQQQIIVDLQQRNSAAKLLPAILAPLQEHLSGTAPLQARLSLPSFDFKETAQRAAQLHVQIKSQLQGIAIDLPKPFAKSANSTRDLQVDLSIPFKRTQPWQLLTQLGRDLHLQAKIPYAQQRGSVIAVGLGGTKAVLPKQGIRIQGQLAQLDILQLLALQQDKSGIEKKKHFPKVEMGMEIGDLRFGELRLGQAQFTLQAQQNLQASLQSPRVHANVFLPLHHPEQGQIRLYLQDLDLAQLAASLPADQQPENASPVGHPSLYARCLRCREGDFAIDRLVVDLQRRGALLQLREFQLQNTNLELKATRGRWYQAEDGKAYTAMDAYLTIAQPAKLLAAKDEEAAFTGGSLQAQGHLYWPGEPFAFALERVGGHLQFQMGPGSLTSIEPGVGRILGLLDPQRLRQRLARDFRDVTTKGVAFDRIYGSLQLQHGIIQTSDVLLSAAALVAGVQGKVDVRREQLDALLTVQPKFDTALPLVGAAVAGPGGGAAMLLLNKLTKRSDVERLQAAGGLYYHIKGAWQEPNVEEIKAAETVLDVDVLAY